MLRILGSKRRLCDPLTRRDLLRIDGLGISGLGLADVLKLVDAAKATPRPASFGRARNLILLHLYGAPSQLEWADMKPHAPVEIRGELGPIASSLPGCHVCELLPNMARVMDRTTVIRSMSHPYPIHGVAYALTGVPSIDVPMELSPHDPRHWPFFGSVVDYLDAQASDQPPPPVPRNIGLPFRFSSRRAGEVPRAGPYAAFLGREFDPVWADYVGRATRGIRKELQEQTFEENDPYIGLDLRQSRFLLPSATDLEADVTLDRLDRRRSLLTQLSQAQAAIERTAAGRALSRHQESAFSLLKSNALRHALDLRREQAKIRESYGDTLFGQACLAARRLVESGGRVVSVFWDEYGLAGQAWDTHWNHFERMRKALCPGLDRAWYGLITDLDQRGLLDETLVVCTSEHGRTPKLNTGRGGGRGHWSRAYTTMVAGAGVPRGAVLGATDKIGSDVTDRPISPKDLLATMYHLLGIDHHTTIQDAQGRPLPLVDGEVIEELVG